MERAFQQLNQKGPEQKEARVLLQSLGVISSIANDYTVYTGPTNFQDAVEQYTRTGIATLSVIPTTELPAVQAEFDTTLQTFPEYKNQPGQIPLLVMGGFAALGNPASFHNPLVRKLRRRCYDQSRAFFHGLIASHLTLAKKLKVEILFDRMMYRQIHQSATAEAWHRDVADSASIIPTDEVLGGWLNLDSQPQYFSCIPGSHLGVQQSDLKSGFNEVYNVEALKVRTEYASELAEIQDKKKFLNEHIKPVMRSLKNVAVRVVIPPGHLLLFPQYLLHEVVADAAKYNMRRLFVGWRITVSDQAFWPETLTILQTQAVPRLPGGMWPPMYAASHLNYFLGMPVVNEVKKANWRSVLVDNYEKLCQDSKEMRNLVAQYRAGGPAAELVRAMTSEYAAYFGLQLGYVPAEDNYQLTVGCTTLPEATNLIKWSKDWFQERILEVRDYKKGMGQYQLIPRVMSSLAHYQFPLYAAYTEEEKSMHQPRRPTFKRKITDLTEL